MVKSSSAGNQIIKTIAIDTSFTFYMNLCRKNMSRMCHSDKKAEQIGVRVLMDGPMYGRYQHISVCLQVIYIYCSGPLNFDSSNKNFETGFCLISLIYYDNGESDSI